MNFTNSLATKNVASCRVAKERYFWEYILATLPVIVLNLGSCPIIILMNMVVTIAIKTRRRLRCKYNILLACLTGTDLAVDVVSQPLFIAREIYFLSGTSQLDECYFFKLTSSVYLVPCLESLLILAIMSTDRYIAMKYSLRYASIVTIPRLIWAVVFSWPISAISLISWLIPGTSSTSSGRFADEVYATVFPAILVIVLLSLIHI